MPLTLLTPPGAEPVALPEAKAWLRVSHVDEDELITDLLRASRERVEAFTGRALIQRQYRESLDDWPLARFSACGTAFALKAPPLLSVEAVRTFDTGGTASAWDPAEWRIDIAADPGRLIAIAPFGFPRPGRRAGGIEIDFTAGYGPLPDDVPAPLREAVLRLVADAYTTVEPADAARRGAGGLPAGVEALLKPYAQVRL